MRKIYLFTSVVALGAAATQCGGEDAAPPAGTGGSFPGTGGASSGGATLVSGGTTPGTGGAVLNGGTPGSGGASSGGAASGGTSSGGASSGGTSSGGSAGVGGAAGGATAGTAGGPGGGTAGTAGAGKGGASGSAGMAGAGGGSAGDGGKAGGGAGGTAGSGGAGGTGGGAGPTFEAVGKILQANCGNACHKAGNTNNHINLSNSDLAALYTRVTTPIPNDIQDCKGGYLVNPAKTEDSILPRIIEKGFKSELGCTDVPRMPNMCGGGGQSPKCLSQGDIDTIKAWVAAGAKGP